MNRQKNHTSLRLLLPLLVVALLLGGFLAYKHWHHPQAVTLSEYNKGEGATPQDTSSSAQHGATSTNSGDSSSGSKDVGATQTLAPDPPSGNFVSSHHVSLSGGGNIASTCNTTPGATCTISFSDGITSKSLPTKTADAGGATYWNWRPSDLGLTTGNWQIKAAAKLNGRSTEATDALNLVIKD